MGACCVWVLLELLLYALRRGVVTLIGKIHLHELTDRVQVVGREFRRFLEGLASFVVLFLLTQDHSEEEVGVGRLRNGLDLLAKKSCRIVQSPQSLISIGEQQASLWQLGLFFLQVLDHSDGSLRFAGTQI